MSAVLEAMDRAPLRLRVVYAPLLRGWWRADLSGLYTFGETIAAARQHLLTALAIRDGWGTARACLFVEHYVAADGASRAGEVSMARTTTTKRGTTGRGRARKTMAARGTRAKRGKMSRSEIGKKGASARWSKTRRVSSRKARTSTTAPATSPT